MRAVSLLAILITFWLLLSGVFNYFLVIAGIIIATLAVWFSRRMEVIDHEGHPIDHATRGILLFWPWLFKEIIFSAIQVSRIIISPSLPIKPKMAQVKITQKSDLGRTIYANAITLTPGTIAVEVEKDTILVHALVEESIDELNRGIMDKRVTKLE